MSKTVKKISSIMPWSIREFYEINQRFCKFL